MVILEFVVTNKASDNYSNRKSYRWKLCSYSSEISVSNIWLNYGPLLMINFKVSFILRSFNILTLVVRHVPHMGYFMLSSLPNLDENSWPNSHYDAIKTVKWIIHRDYFFVILILISKLCHLIDKKCESRHSRDQKPTCIEH